MASSLRENGPAPEDIDPRSPSPTVIRSQPDHNSSSGSGTYTSAEADARTDAPTRPEPIADVSSAAEQHPFPLPYGPAGAAAVGDEGTKTTMQKMAAADEHWMWKMSLRVLVLLVDIIAIGCIGAVMTEHSWSSLISVYEYDYFDESPVVPYALIPVRIHKPFTLCFSISLLMDQPPTQLGISFVWCAIVILVLFLRRPPRAVHPGVAVGIDLVLWLLFIPSILLTAYSASEVASFGSDTTVLEDPISYHSAYEGYYTMAPNGAWVYTITYTRSHYTYGKRVAPATAMATVTATTTGNTVVITTMSTATATSSDDSSYFSNLYDDPESMSSDDDDYYSTYYAALYTTSSKTTRTTSRTSSKTSSTATPSAVIRDCTHEYTSCSEQDAAINTLWHLRGHRLGRELAASVLQGIALLLHFILFVWACVDASRRNRKRRADVVTMDMLESMRSRSYIVVKADQAGQFMGGYPGVGQSSSGQGKEAVSTARFA